MTVFQQPVGKLTRYSFTTQETSLLEKEEIIGPSFCATFIGGNCKRGCADVCFEMFPHKFKDQARRREDNVCNYVLS